MAMLDNGWVVSRFTDGTMRDQGDSLIFTGIAMGALDCARGAVPEAALIKMLDEKHGGVYRHPTIPNEYTLDGLLGLWWGVQERTRRCPESVPTWQAHLKDHERAVKVEPFFSYALETVMARLGLSSNPTPTERGVLGSEVGGWAVTVVEQRAAAYRLHLGFLTLSIVNAPQGKQTYCEAVTDAKIPLIEQFCGRAGLSDWISGFAYNRYVYQFQRGAWESPDGVDGLNTPALDLIMALRMLYPDGITSPSGAPL